MARTHRWAEMLDRDSEKPILEALYVHEAVATDQLRRAPDALTRLTRAFNRLAARDFTGSDLLKYMINRRKCSDWVRLGTGALRFEALQGYLTNRQLGVLKQIYIDLDICSDSLLFAPKLMLEVASRFAGLTGRQEAGATLVGVIMAHRKRGLWPTIRDQQAFGDMEKFA